MFGVTPYGKGMAFAEGQKVHIPGRNLPDWVTVDFARAIATGWKLYVADESGALLTSIFHAGVLVIFTRLSDLAV